MKGKKITNWVEGGKLDVQVTKEIFFNVENDDDMLWSEGLLNNLHFMGIKVVVFGGGGVNGPIEFLN